MTSEHIITTITLDKLLAFDTTVEFVIFLVRVELSKVLLTHGYQ
jgi:hypothetical protein